MVDIMDKEYIKELALDNGFKLKEQPDGSMDLNPYVYEFVSALLNADKHDSSKKCSDKESK